MILMYQSASVPGVDLGEFTPILFSGIQCLNFWRASVLKKKNIPGVLHSDAKYASGLAAGAIFPNLGVAKAHKTQFVMIRFYYNTFFKKKDIIGNGFSLRC